MWCWLEEVEEEEGESIAQKMMIRCCSAFSPILFFLSLFKRNMRLAVVVFYLSPVRAHLWKRKTRQVIDRFLFSFSLSLSLSLSKQVFTKREKRIACSTCLSVSISLLFVQNCTMRSILGQSSTKTNHEFLFSLSPSPIAIENSFAFSYPSSGRAERARRRRRRERRGVTTGACHTSFCVMNILFFSVNREREKNFNHHCLYSLAENLASLSISNHWMRCRRRRKSHNVYSNKMKWTHTHRKTLSAFVSIILRTIPFLTEQREREVLSLSGRVYETEKSTNMIGNVLYFNHPLKRNPISVEKEVSLVQ